MKIFVLARSCEGTGLAHRLAKEHEVYHYSPQRIIGKGLFNKARSLHIDDSFDLAIVTGMGYGKEEDGIGVPKIGGSIFADAIANSIEYRREFLSLSNLPPWGDESGTTFELFGLFNGQEFAQPMLVYYTDERLCEGDLSTPVESMGCVIQTPNFDAKTFYLLAGLTENLKEVKYIGVVNLRVNANDFIRGVDILTVWRHDFFCAFLEGLGTPIEELLLDLAHGELKEYKFFPDPQVAVRVTLPPYPYMTSGLPYQQIYGINEQNEKHIYFRDMIADDGKYLCPRIENVPLVVTAHGSTIKKATNRAYRTINYLECENSQYRRDIGERAEKVFAVLKGEGWM